MLKAIFNWFSNKNPHPNAVAPTVAPEAAPYKIEPPVAAAPVKSAAPVTESAKCGCGRSKSGLCVGLHKLSDQEWAAHADNAKPAKKAAAKKAAPKAKAEKKPAAIKAPKKPKAKKST